MSKVNGVIIQLATGEERAIDQTNKAFEGTSFARSVFQVKYVRLSRPQHRAIEKKHTKLIRRTGRERRDELAIEREKFLKQVTGWQGLFDENEKPIPYSDANKAALYDGAVEFVNLIAAALLQDATGLLDDDEEEDDEGGDDSSGDADPEKSTAEAQKEKQEKN